MVGGFSSFRRTPKQEHRDECFFGPRRRLTELREAEETAKAAAAKDGELNKQSGRMLPPFTLPSLFSPLTLSVPPSLEEE